MNNFDYAQAFSRNIGWVTEAEQARLRETRVAIGGLGGVGGVHLLTLARLGISKFSIADFDVFDIVNFNRQIGALTSTIGRSKLEVLSEMLRDINPDVDLRIFPDGVNQGNIDSFLEGVDVYVDGLDFFVFEARRVTFSACESKGIPVVTAAPLGLGVALVVFGPGSMSYEEYFGFKGCRDELDLAINFLVGLSPAMLQRGYVADMSRVNLRERRGPSCIAACQLCAGVAAVEVLKLALKRPGVRMAPWASQFDAYRMKYICTWRPWGAKNPIQRLMGFLVRRQLGV
ncbi:ThiF family adenylyltransferase [Dechloromonas sp. ARDL1]|uniref:ThiF family adenylyltransferase n=1 Tax=Dechloromonas sp. ARDL1 TaxID=3322121 RepID=UPI003DA7662D